MFLKNFALGQCCQRRAAIDFVGFSPFSQKSCHFNRQNGVSHCAFTEKHPVIQ
jgi:hypothetical protein